MFSGIVEEAAEVLELSTGRDPAKLTVKSALDLSDTKIGDSIAIEGVCLTVVSKDARSVTFELLQETLRCSTLGTLRVGSKVNFERSLKLGDRLHGHFVFGHVDTVIQLLERKADGNCERFSWRIPAKIRPFIAPKCSVSIAGVSLTVGEVTDSSFCVYIIPHTAQVTTLSLMKEGDHANFEIDMLARYVHTLMSVEQQCKK